jgi:acyl carrier protein
MHCAGSGDFNTIKAFLMEELVTIIKTIMENNDKNIKAAIVADSLLRTDIGMDSLDLAELTVIIEDRYNVDIFESEYPETVMDVWKKISNE